MTCVLAAIALSGAVAGVAATPIQLIAGEGIALLVDTPTPHSAASDWGYTVLVDGATWLHSGPVAATFESVTYSTAGDCGENCLVPAAAPIQSTGSDITGSFSKVSIAWVAASGHPEVALTTTFRAYTDVAVLVFGQEYPLGGNGTKASTGRSGTGSLFPSWDLSASDSDGLDYFAGRDQSTMSGKFSEAKVGTGTQGTAVLAVFKAGATGPLRTLVTSPLSAFMASAFDLPSNLLKKSTVSGVGVLGSVTSIPAGFSIETAVVGGRGVADTLMDWGDVLLQRGGKTRTVQDHATDKSLTHIGYWTDNGAWYHYLCSECCTGKGAQNPCPCPEECATGVTMEDTMLAVKADMANRRIPMQYFMFDSWWYPKFGDPSQNSSKPWPIRDTNGMLTWTPEPQVFEDGLKDWLQMPTFLHARYLSSATPYRNDPELAAQLICEEGKSDGMGICLPVGPKPFAKMMQGVQSWTPFLYEQDWISATMEKSVAVVSSVTTGDAWLSGMNEAAGALNMTIQYSMSFSPAILHSTKLQQVTQIRGSGDYEVGSSQWQVGGTSMYYYALGAFASKDTLWTTAHQPGCPKAGAYNCTEPNTKIQIIMATLAGGPVGPGDRLNATNATMTLRSCDATGAVLRPGRPLSILDAQLTSASDTLVWAASTTVPTPPTAGSDSPTLAGHHVVFVSGEGPVSLRPSDLLPVCSNTTLGQKRCPGAPATVTQYIASVITSSGPESDGPWPATDAVRIVTEESPLTLSNPRSSKNGVVPFTYLALTPWDGGVACGGWVIVGELNKVVPLSPKRFGTPTPTSWPISGALNEVVAVTYVKAGDAATVRTAQCTIGADGATLSCSPDAGCAC